MAFQRVGSVQQLPAGSVLGVEIGRQRVAICNVGGQLHALDGTCPHRGGPLAEGALHDTTIVCPWHAWAFDCTTGQNDYNPDLRQRTFPVKLEGGGIFVDAG
jgi:nitrite reductase (NADH) small subunit